MSELLRTLLFLPPEASAMSREIDRLHYVVILLTIAGTTAVVLVVTYFGIRYRRREAGGSTERIETKRSLELGVGGAILGLFLALWLVGFRQYVRLETPPEGTLDVYVTAKQWMWKFAYADGVNAVSQLTVPAGRPVRLIMTSRDVIHSFYVPALRLKQDVIPGRYVTLWFDGDRPGTYEIFCAELCGISHSSMLGSLVVLPPAEYAEWHAAAVARPLGPPSMPADLAGATSMATRGREIALKRGCVACHTLDGQRTLGPSFGGLYLSTVDLDGGRTIVADEAYLTRSMMEPGADIVLGYQNAMPTYQGILRPEEVAALVELIKSVRSGADSPGVALPVLETKP